MIKNVKWLCWVISCIVSVFLLSCAGMDGFMSGGIGGYYYTKGLEAERKGDMVKAAEMYQKTLDSTSDNQRMYIPTELFPDKFRRESSLRSSSVDRGMIYDDLQRVKSTDVYILSQVKDKNSQQADKGDANKVSSQKEVEKTNVETKEEKIVAVTGSSVVPQQGEVKVAEVVVSGTSNTREGALKEALRNAVEQGVGVFIDSATYVKNNQVIHDEILSYSKGYILDYNVISEEKIEEGYRVKIQAKVDSKKVEKKLAALNIIKLKGKAIFADSLTEIDKKQNAIR